MGTLEKGKFGEAEAAKFMRNNGYQIVSMGFHSRFGEIDVIAENEEYVVFVEVKTRKNSNFAAAREYVDFRKQRRILSTAKMWLARSRTQKQPRFDVIEIYADNIDDIRSGKGHMTINHIKNAF